ncbi:MAG: acyl-CoA dehydrogenase family protein [Thermoplasmata archaeon]
MALAEDETEAWRGRARRWAEQELAPIAEEIDRSDRAPPDLPRRLGSAGFLGLGQPRKWGGGGESMRTVVAVLEELARVSSVAAVAVAVHLSVAATPLARWGTEGQREQYLRPLLAGRALGAFALTEPEAGSNAAGLRCRYRWDGDTAVVQGSKTFITNGGIADLLILFVTRDPAEGRNGISAFLLPKGTPGFRASPSFPKLGLRGSPTSELTLEEVRLPQSLRLGAEGQGLSIALEALLGGRVGIAACALGVARAGFEELRAATRERPAEWKGPLLARSFAELEAAAALVERAAAARDRGEPFRRLASAAKLVASRAAVEIAGRAVEAWESPAGRRAARAERIYRDARVYPIVEGTSEIQEMILGRDLLRAEAAASGDPPAGDK